MNRCTVVLSPSSFSAIRKIVLASLSCALLLAAQPASAQVPSGTGITRNFPDAALRGTLTVTSAVEGTLNSKAIRMAPGMRLFSPQNSLVMAHSVIGQKFKVNYVIEASTGMLLSAWILTESEATVPRKGSADVERNYRSEFDTLKK
jgi:hypothetical protein